MSHTFADWAHPADPRFDDAAPHELGVAHRNQLIVDERDWPAVEQALAAAQVSFRVLGTSYGLVRVALDEQYEDVLYQEQLIGFLRREVGPAPRLGRNRLLAHAFVEFDDDSAEATPRVAPSAADRAQLAPDDLPTRRFVTAGNGSVDTVATSGGLTSAGGDPLPGTTLQIGVVDTTFVPHPFLAGTCTYRPADLADLLTADGAVGGTTGHATFVAGLIHQIAPGATIHVESVIGSDGLADAVDVHDAICRLVEKGVQVVNLSLGCVTADNELPFVLDHALGWAEQRKLPQPAFVASAGNTGSSRRFWPAADNRVRSVAGATRAGDSWELAADSGHGDWVEVAAPSDGICGPHPYLPVGAPVELDRYAYWSGTSFATAIVSGLMAAQLGSLGPVGLTPVSEWSAPLHGPSDEIKNGAEILAMYGAGDVNFKP